MQNSNAPTKIQLPFANAGTKNTIPVASQIGVTPGAASFTDGFPPATMTPIAAGGVPPFGADFNGVLFASTSADRWSQAGGGYVYDSTFSTAIGGYPRGARLLKSTFDGYWISTVDNNTTNPDTGGAGWLSAEAGRLIKVTTFTSNGTFTANSTTKMIRARGVGGGAAGGSTGAQGANQCSVGGGGGSGAWFEGVWTSNFASIPIVIGAGGTPTLGQVGGNGGQTALGSLAAAPGGGGGGTSQASTSANYFLSGQGGAALPAAIGGGGIGFVSGGNPAPSGLGYTGNLISGQGAGCPYGGGANNTNNGSGGNGTGNGSGGAGAATGQNTAGSLGGNGQPGLIIIEEFA